MELIILRHGSTSANERRLYIGSTDEPLSELGLRQAALAGVCPDVARVFVSPMRRARQTAAVCFPNARQVVLDGLREMDFGVFEGRSAEDMKCDADYCGWVDGMCTGRCPGGEARDDLTRRVAQAVRDAVDAALEAGESRVVVAGHGGTVMAAMHVFADSRADYFSWHVGNCGGYRMRVEVDGGSLQFADWERFDDLSFMSAPGNASFFANRGCEYFPCHEGVAPEEFNCMFCYCPLYTLGPECGGNCSYTESGRKNCTACTLPHEGSRGAKLVAARYDELAALARPAL